MPQRRCIRRLRRAAATDHGTPHRNHRNDPTILARWLANKTPEIVASWIIDPANSMLLAVEAGHILAAGCVTDEGKITLNYVAPEARFRGVSRALLAAVEARATSRGNTRCWFFRHRGRLPDVKTFTFPRPASALIAAGQPRARRSARPCPGCGRTAAASAAPATTPHPTGAPS